MQQCNHSSVEVTTLSAPELSAQVRAAAAFVATLPSTLDADEAFAELRRDVLAAVAETVAGTEAEDEGEEEEEEETETETETESEDEGDDVAVTEAMQNRAPQPYFIGRAWAG